MEGIESIKKVVGFGLDVAADVVKARADGKIDWKDGFLVIDDIPKIPSLIKAVPKLKAEFQDMTEEEKDEILSFVREKSVCDVEKAESILEGSFTIALGVALLIDEVIDLATLIKANKAV